MLKGLAFDLDGVITDTAKFHYQAWRELARPLGIEVTPAINEQLKGVSRLESLAIILRSAHQFDRYSVAEREALAQQKNDQYVRMIQTMTPADILPGIIPLLKAAKAEHLKISLASASKNAPMILTRLGLTDYFDQIVDPATLHHGKPDPEIFQRAAASMQLDNQEVVGLEDSQAGITAINAAGQFSVGIGTPQQLGAADYLVPTTSELTLFKIKEAFDTSSKG